MKGRIFAFLRVFVSIGLIAFLVWSMRAHLPRIGSTIAKTQPLLFALAALLFIANAATISFRLQLLFVGENLRIPFGRVVQLSYIGFFFNNFMPTAVGGDIVKAYYANKQTKETTKSFISVFMDRFIGIISFGLIAVVALFFSWENIGGALRKIVLIFALGGIAGLFIILNPSAAKLILNGLSWFKPWGIGERLARVYMAVHDYRKKKALIFAATCVSLIAQILYFLVVYLLAKSLGADLRLVSIFLIMPIVSLVSMLPSLGGLGLRESALVVLFGPLIGSDNAFSVSILLLATLLITSLIGAAIYVSAAQFRGARAEMAKLQPYSV